MPPRPSPKPTDAGETGGNPAATAAIPVAEERVAEAGQRGPLPEVDEKSYPPGATPLQPTVGHTLDVDGLDVLARRIDQIEETFGRFADGIDKSLRRFAHVIDGLAANPPAVQDGDAPAAAKRVRSDEELLSMPAGMASAEELLRLVELKSGEAELRRLQAEGIHPSTHWISADCMVLPILVDGKPVPTKVHAGEAIPREKLSGDVIEWGLKHPDGARFVRPGEYKAPKAPPAHTR